MSKFDKIIDKIEEFEITATNSAPVEKQHVRANKYDRLIKKVELFEKLSVYGDRATFLDSLAQAQALTPQMRELLDSTLKNVSAVRSEVPGISQYQNTLMDALNSDTPDMTALQNAMQHVSTQFASVFGAVDSRAQQAQQLFSMLQGPAPVLVQDKAVPRTPAPPKQQMAQIDPKIQLTLGVQPDGQLGPVTRGALDKFKQNQGNPAMTDAQAFAALRGITEVGPDLTDAARQKNELATNQGKSPIKQ